ncbi:MAG: protein kinase [Thermodesulfobacteriota bacterium]|nr:MAG: protein kinase [Thermodesulfobacteriota bacterium]
MSEKNEILLINRDKGFLEDMAGSLRQAEFKVHTAFGMHEALLALTFYPVGLILCDNVLQDVTGYDFLRFLKNDPLRDSVPFVFFVPINDQGHAFKAFELGADDFLVYPMEVEDFVSRIKEIMALQYPAAKEIPVDGSGKASPLLPADTTTPPQERRRAKRKQPLPNLKVSLSRDEILWMPGRIKNFSLDGMLVITSLLGKPGVSLIVKFSLPQGVVTIKGHIKHVAFDDFRQPVGLGVTFPENSAWREINDYFTSLINSADPGTSKKESCEQQTPSPPQWTGAGKTVFLPYQGSEGEDFLLSDSAPRTEEETYESRFYHSLVGKQLGSYKAVCFIGSGSMGGVFKGWDSALEREVALKVISFELSSQETFREMFIKEARLISKLDHPNIAHIYSIGDTDGILFFAMELIAGETLSDLIIEHGNLNTLKGLDYLLTVCQTLDFVRQKNIIHRDIKPENIVINDKGVLKIVDFGVAKKIDVNAPGEMPEGIVGSPLYISPESISGHVIDHRSDIYSLGATFYHVFTGYPPFEGDDAKTILLHHLNSKSRPLKERNPKVSVFLSRVIEKMMAKDPQERYQNYKTIVQELQSFRSMVIQAKKKKNSFLPGTGQ